jgi:hypothetical protein
MSIEAMKQALEALERAAELLTRVGLCFKGIDKTITSLRQAIAEAEKQEPDAYVSCLQNNSPIMCDLTKQDAEGLIALYTHPQPKREWVGLTPHERMMCRSYDVDETIAKTEAKLKEKNT